MILLILDTSLASRGKFQPLVGSKIKVFLKTTRNRFTTIPEGVGASRRLPPGVVLQPFQGGRGFWKVGTSKRLPEAVLQAPRRPEASGRLPEAVLHPLIGLPKAPSL